MAENGITNNRSPGLKIFRWKRALCLLLCLSIFNTPICHSLMKKIIDFNQECFHYSVLSSLLGA